MRRGEKIRELTDRRILRSVLQVALSRGEHAVTMESVSSDSGIAKTTLYHRYKNRLDMLHQLAQAVEAKDFSPHGFPTTPSGLEDYCLWLAKTYSHIVDATEIAALLFARTPFLLAVGHKIIQALHSGMVQLIEEGQRTGAFPIDVSPRIASDLIIGGVLFGASSDGTITRQHLHEAIMTVFPTVHS